MEVFKLAWQAAGIFKPKLVLLTIQSFIVALLEAVTLILLFAFVSSLISQSVEGNKPAGLSSIREILKNIDLIYQAGIILLLASLRFILTMMIEWQSSQLWVNMRSLMQQRMLRAHLNANLGFILSKKLGEHVNHVIDGPAFAAVFYLHLVRFSSTAIMLILLVVTLSFISLNLMMIAAILIVFYGLVIKKLSKTLSYEMGNRQALAVKSQSALASEGVSGIRYIKMLGGIERWMDQFKVNADEAAFAMQRGGFWNTVPSRAIEYLILVFFLGLVVTSLTQERSVILDIPTLAVYFLAIIRILPSLSILGNGKMQMMQSLPYLQKYIELSKYLPQENTNSHSHKVDSFDNPNVQFENVSFSYGDQNVLKQINFEIPSGRFVALVGQSGQGKSTILDLLVGFLNPSSGQVLIGGKPVQEFDIGLLRKKFAYVGQDTFLFHDTLRENIRFSNPLATDEEVKNACMQAGAFEFLESFPQGLDTVLADRGASISGGQRQRIAIARALISPARFLLLDEPTSALDVKTERDVMNNISKFRKDKTIVLVTHKTELFKYADLILVVIQGDVLKVETPEEAIMICQKN
jgi:ABC-type multidrug transport system fused ATPase/permease subunit